MRKIIVEFEVPSDYENVAAELVFVDLFRNPYELGCVVYDKSQLQNLLAVIHRDGGHYTEKHGVEKSCKDAMQIVSDLIHEELGMEYNGDAISENELSSAEDLPLKHDELGGNEDMEGPEMVVAAWAMYNKLKAEGKI